MTSFLKNVLVFVFTPYANFIFFFYLQLTTWFYEFHIFSNNFAPNQLTLRTSVEMQHKSFFAQSGTGTGSRVSVQCSKRPNPEKQFDPKV